MRGPTMGAIVYNVAHDLATGAAIAGVGLAIGSVPLAAAGAVLVAHSGMDRMMGYGLKSRLHSRTHTSDASGTAIEVAPLFLKRFDGAMNLCSQSETVVEERLVHFAERRRGICGLVHVEAPRCLG